MTRWLPLAALALATLVVLVLLTFDAAEPLHIAMLLVGTFVGFLFGVSAGLEWSLRHLR
jgi:uncharacterized membrane protein YqjE